MTTPRLTACEERRCANFRETIGPPEDPVFICMAFPAGVPEVILSGTNYHTEPYPGDGGIQFEPMEGYDEKD